MPDERSLCPSCQSGHTIKNGTTHHRKSQFQCQSCGRQFILNPSQKIISDETKALIDKLLLEKISLAGIARVTGVSETWLQAYVNSRYEQTPRQLEASSKKKGRLVIQCDELWSFVGYKANKQWLWLALDTDTKEVVGLYLGSRGESGAQGLWNSLPAVYRQCAVCYTDFWEAYAQVIPSKRHRAVGKETGLTNYIERFNNTLRQRVARLGRATLAFSKKLENHLGAIGVLCPSLQCFPCNLSCATTLVGLPTIDSP